METLRQGAVHTGLVEGYSSEGLGVVRLDGAVVFVPGAVRGEEIDLEIRRVMRACAAGEVVRVRTPSPARTRPSCPWFGRCGGCDFQHVTYEEELWAKRQRVQDALSRIGGSDVRVEEILGAPDTAHYRNKSQYPVGPDGTIGFYRAGSHQVVPVDRCQIQSEEADRTARAVGDWMKRYHVPGYDERTGKGLVRHVYVRTDRRGGSLCCVVANGKQLPREAELAALVLEAVPKTVGVVLNGNTRRSNVILGDRYRTIWGRDHLEDTLCGLEFRLSVPSFYQVHRSQAEVLYGKALDFAALTGRETVLDLYCGIGTLTLCLARRAGRAVGAEIVPQAVADARENARRNRIGNVEFFCGDAAAVAEELSSQGLRPDVIAVDPPRKGLGPEAVEAVTEMGPERVVYVSCDPGTLARDVARFARRGYRAVRATAVDLFPRTAHVETVVLLSKREIDSQKVRVESSLEDMDVQI